MEKKKMKTMNIWDKLYNVAKEEYKPHDLSPFFYANHVACAIEAEDGTIYKGFCIEGASGVLNLCAERVAALNMIVNSNQTVIKRILVMRDVPPYKEGNFIPCGACREFLLQLNIKNKDTQILIDYETKEYVLLESLLPKWWGTERYQNK